MAKKVTGLKKARRKTKSRSPSAAPMSPWLAEHLEGSERVMKKVLASKRNSIAFLIKVGILDKKGKGLAKPYR